LKTGEPNELQRLEEAFARVMAGEAADRRERLRAIAAESPDLGHALEELITAAESSSGLGEEPRGRPVPTIGTTIDGYTLVEPIGSGGFGVVFRALQTQPIQRNVAIKFIRLDKMPSEIATSIAKERQALAQLDHPSIVRILDAGSAGGRLPYVVMELVRGQPITHYCDERRMTIRERVALVARVCEGMEHAHSKGVVHRDLKPSNVMISTDGVAPAVKIIDFGISSGLHDMIQASVRLDGHRRWSSSTGALGTPMYMAPEQATDGASASPRMDVYALGSLCQELVIGVPVFSRERFAGKRIAEVLDIVRNEATRTLTHWLGPAWSELDGARILAMRGVGRRELLRLTRGDLEQIIAKATHKNPSERYVHAGELGDDLRRYVRHEPVRANEGGAWSKVTKLAARNRLATSLVLGLFAVLLGGLVSSTVLYRRASERGRQLQVEAMLAAQAREAAEHRAREAEAATADAIAASYASAMQAAANRLQVRDIGGLRGILEGSEPSLRGWEWRYLSECLDQSRGILINLQDRITSFDVDAGGTTVVAGSVNGRVELALIAPNSTPVALASHDSEVRDLRFSKDTSMIASVDVDGFVKVSNQSTRSLRWSVRVGQQGLDCVGFALDDSVVVAGGYEGILYIAEAATGRIRGRLEGHRGGILKLQVFPSGRHVATASSDGDVRVWDLERLACLQVLPTMGEAAVAVALSPDERLIAGGGANGSQRLWDASTGESKPVNGLHRGLVYAIKFSPDGRRLASVARGGTLVVSHVDGSERAQQAEADRVEARGVQWSVDGRTLVTVGADGLLRWWNAETLREIFAQHGNERGAGEVAFCLNESAVITSSSDGTVRLWARENPMLREVLEGHREMLRFAELTEDGRFMFTGGMDATATLWDTTTGQMVRKFLGHTWHVRGGVIARDGTWAATGSADGRGMIWDVATGEVRYELLGHAKVIRGIVKSPDERQLVTYSTDKTARLWDTATGSCLAVCEHSDLLTEAVFTPDARYFFTASEDGMIRKWNAESGKPEGDLPGHINTTVALDVSSDGRWLASGSNDGTARVWNVDSRETVVTLRGHEGEVSAVRFFKDGQRLVTGSHDHTMRVWNWRRGETVATMRGHVHHVFTLDVSPDGSRVVSSSRDGSIRLWETTRGRELMTLATNVALGHTVHFDRTGDRIIAACHDHTARIWSAAKAAR
jgi:eukaryotic-like serine/threonine-protein kinase